MADVEGIGIEDHFPHALPQAPVSNRQTVRTDVAAGTLGTEVIAGTCQPALRADP